MSLTIQKDSRTMTLPISVEQGMAATTMTARYGFIDTNKVLDVFRENDFLVAQSNVLRPRKRDPRTVRHLVRLRRADQLELLNGGVVPEVVMINAHDGSSSLKFMVGLFRMVCSNGLIVQSAKLFPTISIRHNVNAMGLALQAANNVLEAATRSTDRITTFQQRMLTPAAQLEFATRANALWTGRVRPEALLEMRRDEDAGDDLWRVFNRVQENLMVGGLTGTTATGRRTRTHGIKAMDNSVRVNRQLWSLAEEFAA